MRFFNTLTLAGILVWSAVLSTGCATGGTGMTPDPTPLPLQIVLVSADFAAGEPRISFALFDGAEPVADAANVRIRATALEDDPAGDGSVVWEGPATGYTDYEIPYWVIYPRLAVPGYYGLTADIETSAGATSQARFIVEIKPASESPAVGDRAPLSRNRTVASEPDLNRLSSAADPDPAFHRLTVADAVADGRPTVVGFLTPGFCRTKWCAPVLDTLKAARNEAGDKANFIHIEVYDDFQKLTLVKEMAEWGLDSEPWVFVLDGDGRVVARFSGPLSPEELMAALRPLLAQTRILPQGAADEP